MNPVVDIIFTLSWFILLIFAVRSISRGWSLMTQPIERNTPNGIWTTEVKKPVHPEMVEVKPGEQLMGVTFSKESTDPLQQSLQNRIKELNDPWEDDDDDDGDADIVVRT